MRPQPLTICNLLSEKCTFASFGQILQKAGSVLQNGNSGMEKAV